jgi:transcriptional regulator with XRE-family HTH domain
MKINKFKFYRLQEGLSQAEAAKLIGISRAYISLFETGRATPSEEITCRLARAYGIEAKELM